MLLAYLELAALPEDSPEKDKLSWAFDEMWTVLKTDPELAWRIVLAACEEEMLPEVAAFFAAGPLEDLLVNHGPVVIDRVVSEAQRNPKLNFLLGGVWQRTIPKEIWERVAEVRREVW